MGVLDWAKREVDVVIANTKKLANEECEYYSQCCISALKAYESLCEDGHSGFSIRVTQNILNKLIDGIPLSPITEEDFNEEKIRDDRSIQCSRMSSLFKEINKDGEVVYNDINRTTLWVNNISWHSGLADKIIDEMFPISLPYSGAEHYDLYGEEVLTDSANGDYDTVAIYKIKIKSTGEEIEINRYFREPEKEGEVERYPGWVEIYKDEWGARVQKDRERVALLNSEE